MSTDKERFLRSFRTDRSRNWNSRIVAATSERASRLEAVADACVAYYDWARARLRRAVAEQSLGLNRGTLHSKLHKYGLLGAEEAGKELEPDG